MRVLITGGYGFIGSFVAETFYTEGHDVYILDNLTTGNKNNVRCKHKFYQLNTEDKECEEIFESNKFDVVIHLAAQASTRVSMENPYLDSESNVLGLTNMLYLSKKYCVKKVVFVSSAAVYGYNENIPLTEDAQCDPMSPYGMNKLVGEMYCNKWKEIFDVETICFRLSNVYGPRQGISSESGVISTFIQQVINGQELVVFGDGEQTRDFIYVQDVSEAIYRAVEYDLTGLYNLSTNTETSIKELIRVFHSMEEVSDITYQEVRHGDIRNSRLDNTKIKKDLDWIPLHHFQEGIEKTVQWFKSNSITKEEKKQKEWQAPFQSFLPYIENMTLLCAMIFISTKLVDSLNMVDYKLVYIIIASFLLSRNQSIMSIGFAIAWFIYEEILNGRDFIAIWIEQSTLIHIGLYIFCGLTISYVLDKKEKTIQAFYTETKKIKDKYQALHEIYYETLSVKDELQEQILYTNDSFGTVCNMMKDLDSLNPTNIYTSSITIVEKIMKSDKVAFYMVDDATKIMKLVAKSSELESNSLHINEHIRTVLITKQMYINKSFDKKQPTIISPIILEGVFIGMICVYSPTFEYLTLFYQNLLTVSSNLISSALACAFEHQKEVASKVDILRKNKEESYV